MFDKVEKGEPVRADTINQIQHKLADISGSDGISDLDGVYLGSRRNKPSRGGSTTAVVRATVIETLTYPDLTADPESPEYEGRAYYTCRLLTDTTAEYSAVTEYDAGEFVVAANNKRYVSLQSGNSGNEPSANPAWWEQTEEIKVEYALDYDDVDGAVVVAGFDLRDCSPWLIVGSIVRITSRTIGATTRYYIDRSFTYMGTPEEASQRVDSTTFVTHAVFQ